MQSNLNKRTVCNVCNAPGTLEGAGEVVEVGCNVRQHIDKRFTVWRCDNCRSLHSRDIVEMEHYYADYPFVRQKSNLFWKLSSWNYIRRLVKAGYKREMSLLDYGCGSGMLLKHFRRQKYRNTRGYDPYDPRYNDPTALEETYDFVVLQDVIEHVEEPGELLDKIISLTKPGGTICIGSPNADKLDLGQLGKCVHSLHQPYHLHILSEQALRDMAVARGLTAKKFYDIYYADTFVPMANVRFSHYYASLFDNTLDLAFDGYRFHWKQFMPKGQALAYFGRFFPPHYEMMLMFQK